MDPVTDRAADVGLSRTADVPLFRPVLSRGLMIAIGIAAALVAALGLRAFAGVVAPLFLALVLSITVQPLRRLLVRHGLPAWLRTVLSLVGGVVDRGRVWS